MKKILILLSLLLPLFGNNSTISAQTGAVKKAAQSVFSLTTFKKDGTLLNSTHGVFVGNNGDAIASWKVFDGAATAVVIDAQGKKHIVEYMIGCNDIYDVCKFHVDGVTTPGTCATQPAAKNSSLWFVTYGVKNQKFLHAKVQNVEKFMEKYNFYILDIMMTSDADFCPVVNDNGQIVALTQPTSTKNVLNAVDASFVESFFSSSLSMANQTLKKTLIPAELPSTAKDAQLALILARQNLTEETYLSVIKQFISKFPTLPDGYEARAIYEAQKKDFSAASADMEKSIEVATDKSEAYYSYCQLIMQKIVTYPDDSYPDWTYDKALELIKKAQENNNVPSYRDMEGKILFAQKKYEEAYKVFMALQDTYMKGPETMEEALQCKQQLGAGFDEQIELMDSIIASCPHPLTYQSGVYILQRAMMYHQHGNYRNAIQEYNDYEKLMVGNKLPASFYYTRFTCERDGKVYQLALDDIEKAITLDPNNPVYLCEQGSLLLRLGKYQEAIDSANKCLIIDNSNADAYAILGSGQCLIGKKYEGMLNLDEAKRKGYQNADALIEKFK